MIPSTPPNIYTHTQCSPSPHPFTPSASEPGTVSNGVATPIDAPRPAERVHTRPSEGPSAGDCGKSDLWCPWCCWPVTSAPSLSLFFPFVSLSFSHPLRPPSVTYLFNFLKLQNIYVFSWKWEQVLTYRLRFNKRQPEWNWAPSLNNKTEVWTKGTEDRMGKGLLRRKGWEKEVERKDDSIS